MEQPPSDRREIQVGPLPSFEELLWEWVAIQERSIRLWSGKDAIWWYNERPSLGGFAGAVWRSGGFVLEEYSTQKVAMGPGNNNTSAAGRGDMDFALGGWRFTIEAKQCWPRLGTKKPLLRVEKALKLALRDAEAAHAKPGYTKLAVVFAGIGSNKLQSLDSQISQWVDAARALKGCACAFAFPALGRKLFYNKYCKVYPGAALFIKYAGGRRPPAYSQ